jgi:hypothetical protein
MLLHKFAITALGVFNLVSGALVALSTAILFLFGFALSGGDFRWYDLIWAFLPVAGACHALGGASMLAGIRSDFKQVMFLLALAICLSLVFMVVMTWPLLSTVQKEGVDSFLLGFYLFPGVFALLDAVELAYVSRVRKWQLASGAI